MTQRWLYQYTLVIYIHNILIALHLVLKCSLSHFDRMELPVDMYFYFSLRLLFLFAYILIPLIFSLGLVLMLLSDVTLSR